MYFDLYDLKELEGYIETYKTRLAGGANINTLYDEISYEYKTYIGPTLYANQRLYKSIQGLAYAYVELHKIKKTNIRIIDHYIEEIYKLNQANKSGRKK